MFFLGALTAIASVAPASAAGRQTQSCDPAYGCTPSTPPVVNPSCSLSGGGSASQGDAVVATLINVPVGTSVTLQLDGSVVGSGVAAEGVGGASPGSGGVTIQFTVPTGMAPGKHTLVFVGAGVLCDPTGGAGFGVLGLSLSRSLPSSPSSPSSGGLARTGLEVAMFLAIALALFVAGWMLVGLARRRRRRVARARNDVQHLSNR